MTIRIPVADPGAVIRAHRAAVDQAMGRVLDSGWYILGQEVLAFEEEFGRYLGVGHVVGVASGTDAIELALRATGVAAGDGVLVPTNTAVATVAAIERAEATPVLCDVDPETSNLDATKLDEVIQQAPIRIRAIVAVHLYGVPADMDALVDVAQRHGLIIVEDCAQAHGARHRGRTVGTIGSAAAFSFYPTKNLGTVGDGGAIAFVDGRPAARARALRQYGWRQRYISQDIGTNSRLDELHAAVLRVLLPHLDAANEHRRRIAARYLDGLAGADLRLPTVPAGCEPVWHQFVIGTPRRAEVADRLAERGIGSALLYPVPVHQQPAYAGRVPVAASLAIAERLADELLCLPIGPHVDEAMGDEVVRAIVDITSS